MSTALRGALATLLFLAPTTAAAKDAPPPAADLGDWLRRVDDVFDALAEARRIRPPQPVKVRWKLRELWTGSLPGPVLAMSRVDLYRTGAETLLVLTPGFVHIFSERRGAFSERQRLPLQGALSSRRSREPIGMIEVVDNGTGRVLRARSSERAQMSEWQLLDDGPQPSGEHAGFPLCGGAASMEPGRNFYRAGIHEAQAATASAALPASPRPFMHASCEASVAPDGRRLRYHSEVGVDATLRIQCAGLDEFCDKATRSYPQVGYAHLVADINRDGYAEVLTSAASAPGGEDTLSVFSQAEHDKRLLFTTTINGAIEAIGKGDFNGDGADEVVVASRKGREVQLWLVN